MNSAQPVVPSEGVTEQDELNLRMLFQNIVKNPKSKRFRKLINFGNFFDEKERCQIIIEKLGWTYNEQTKKAKYKATDPRYVNDFIKQIETYKDLSVPLRSMAIRAVRQVHMNSNANINGNGINITNTNVNTNSNSNINRNGNSNTGSNIASSNSNTPTKPYVAAAELEAESQSHLQGQGQGKGHGQFEFSGNGNAQDLAQVVEKLGKLEHFENSDTKATEEKEKEKEKEKDYILPGVATKGLEQEINIDNKNGYQGSATVNGISNQQATTHSVNTAYAVQSTQENNNNNSNNNNNNEISSKSENNVERMMWSGQNRNSMNENSNSNGNYVSRRDGNVNNTSPNLSLNSYLNSNLNSKTKVSTSTSQGNSIESPLSNYDSLPHISDKFKGITPQGPLKMNDKYNQNVDSTQSMTQSNTQSNTQSTTQSQPKKMVPMTAAARMNALLSPEVQAELELEPQVKSKGLFNSYNHDDDDDDEPNGGGSGYPTFKSTKTNDAVKNITNSNNNNNSNSNNTDGDINYKNNTTDDFVKDLNSRYYKATQSYSQSVKDALNFNEKHGSNSNAQDDKNWKSKRRWYFYHIMQTGIGGGGDDNDKHVWIRYTDRENDEINVKFHAFCQNPNDVSAKEFRIQLDNHRKYTIVFDKSEIYAKTPYAKQKSSKGIPRDVIFSVPDENNQISGLDVVDSPPELELPHSENSNGNPFGMAMSGASGIGSPIGSGMGSGMGLGLGSGATPGGGVKDFKGFGGFGGGLGPAGMGRGMGRGMGGLGGLGRGGGMGSMGSMEAMKAMKAMGSMGGMSGMSGMGGMGGMDFINKLKMQQQMQGGPMFGGLPGMGSMGSMGPMGGMNPMGGMGGLGGLGGLGGMSGMSGMGGMAGTPGIKDLIGSSSGKSSAIKASMATIEEVKDSSQMSTGDNNINGKNINHGNKY